MPKESYELVVTRGAQKTNSNASSFSNPSISLITTDPYVGVQGGIVANGKASKRDQIMFPKLKMGFYFIFN